MESLEPKYILSDVLPKIQDMPGLKNPFPKRKRGNKLVIFMALKLGEKGFDMSNVLLRLILYICQDTNYKIRLDGMRFFKEYLQDQKIIECDRFKEVYHGELLEMLKDEECYI